MLTLTSNNTVSWVKFVTLRETFHSLAACWQSSCSHLCYCRQRSAWPYQWWPLAEIASGPGSRQSRRERASEYLYRNRPGRSSRSLSTGSSTGSKEALWWRDDRNWLNPVKGKRESSISSDVMEHLVYHKNRLFPTWPDSSNPQWLQSLRFSSARPFCSNPNRYTSGQITKNTHHANVNSLNLWKRLTEFRSWPLE